MEKSNTMEMATMAVMGSDPQNVSKLGCLWLCRRVAKRLDKQNVNIYLRWDPDSTLHVEVVASVCVRGRARGVIYEHRCLCAGL